MVDDRYRQIWRNYATFKKQETVMRAGFARVGVYPGTPDGRTEPLRSESVAEHVLGTLELLDEIAMFCPEMMSEAETLRCMRLLLKHEVGEVEIGDIPDDGRYDGAKKDENELRVMMRYAETLPAPYGIQTVHDFVDFQNKRSALAQMAYCIDKIEAVLQCLLYEQEGRNVTCVDETLVQNLSEQDRKYMRQTGSAQVVDNWSAHCLDLIRDFWCAPMFVGILRAAVEDVRGEWFPWIEKT